MKTGLYAIAWLVALAALALVGRMGWKEFRSSAKAALVGDQSPTVEPGQLKHDRIELPVVALGLAREQISRLEREKAQIAQERELLRSETEKIASKLSLEASLRQIYELREALSADTRKPKIVPGPLELHRAPGFEGGPPRPPVTVPSYPIQPAPPEPVSLIDVKATILNSVSCPSSREGPGLPILLDVRLRDLIYKPNAKGVPELECTVLARCTGDPVSGRIDASPVLLSCAGPTRRSTVVVEREIKGRLMDSDSKDGLPGTVRRKKEAVESGALVDALVSEISRVVGPTALSSEFSDRAAHGEPGVSAHAEAEVSAHGEPVEPERKVQGNPVERAPSSPSTAPLSDPSPPVGEGTVPGGLTVPGAPRMAAEGEGGGEHLADLATTDPTPPPPVRKLNERMRETLNAALKEVTAHYGKQKAKRLAVVEVSAGMNVTLAIQDGFDLISTHMLYGDLGVTSGWPEDLPPRFKVGP